LIELFFQSYTNQLSQHIESEEKGIIAYAKSVESGRSDLTYHTEDYLEHHDDVDSVLNRLCALLNDPTEPSSQLSLSNLLSTQLQLLQRELYIHSLLEEQVFLDILIQREKKYQV
jgi:iron-sulfur cluster repair protein YtfE (RIC family)